MKKERLISFAGYNQNWKCVDLQCKIMMMMKKLLAMLGELQAEISSLIKRRAVSGFSSQMSFPCFFTHGEHHLCILQATKKKQLSRRSHFGNISLNVVASQELPSM